MSSNFHFSTNVGILISGHKVLELESEVNKSEELCQKGVQVKLGEIWDQFGSIWIELDILIFKFHMIHGQYNGTQLIYN